MMRIYRSTEGGLMTTDQPSQDCWLDVTAPSPDEVEHLVQAFRIPRDFVAHALGLDEIPLVEKEEGALLILVRLPHFQGATARIPYVTVPMGIIMTRDRVVTICGQPHHLLETLPHEHQSDLSTAQPTRLILHLLWGAANSYLLHLRDINQRVEEVEERLERSLQNREVLELLRHQKSLVHFTTALRANETMLERLRKGDFLAWERQDESLLDDVFTEHQQAIGMSQIASDILSQMMDAFASIISNNLNVVMKFLAAVAVILVVPTIIGTFYGMNVRLPLEDHPLTFLGLMGLSLVSSLIVGLFLWKKGWL